MTTPLSLRFIPSLLARLRQRANAVTGASVAGLAQRLIDEGLRMADRPLTMALHAWLTAGPPAPPVTESWLLGAEDSQ